jgi:hypothetical protein
VKIFPRELVGTMVGNPWILVDGYFLYGHQQSVLLVEKEGEKGSRMNPMMKKVQIKL